MISMSDSSSESTDTASTASQRRIASRRIDSAEGSVALPHSVEPESRSTVQFAPMSLASYAEIPFRYRWTLVRYLLASLIVGLLIIAVWPRQYQSEARLKIRIGRSSVALDPTVTTSETMLLQKTLQEEVVSTLSVLDSREVKSRVVDELGPDAILEGYLPGEGGPSSKKTLVAWLEPKVRAAKDALHQILLSFRIKDPVDDHELAVMQLEKSVVISAPKLSSVVTVQTKSKSPEMAQRLASSVVDAFLHEHVQASSTPGSKEFFTKEVEEARIDLEQAMKLRSEFLRDEELVSITANQTILQDKLVTVNRDLMQAIGQLESTLAAVTDLEAKLERMDDEILSSKQQAKSTTWSAMRQKVYELEVEERRLTATVTRSHPELVRARNQLNDARDILESIESDDVSAETRVNPAKLEVETELRRQQTTIASLRSVIQEKLKQTTELDNERVALIESERQLSEMDRQVAVMQTNLSLLETKLEQSRLIEALESERFSNVTVFQPATLIKRPVSPNKKLFAIASVFAGGFFGLCVALLKSASSQSLQTTEQLERIVHSDLIHEIPYTGRRTRCKSQSHDLLEAALTRKSMDPGSGRVIGVMGCHQGCGSSTLTKAIAATAEDHFFERVHHLDASEPKLSIDQLTQKCVEIDEQALEHDLLVVDLPPAGHLGQSGILQHVDQVILVLQADVTTAPVAKRALQLLSGLTQPQLVAVALNKTKHYLPQSVRRLLAPGNA